MEVYFFVVSRRAPEVGPQAGAPERGAGGAPPEAMLVPWWRGCRWLEELLLEDAKLRRQALRRPLGDVIRLLVCVTWHVLQF